jgi:hypothetical protein
VSASAASSAKARARSQKPRPGETRAKVLPAGVAKPADHPTAGKTATRPRMAAARRWQRVAHQRRTERDADADGDDAERPCRRQRRRQHASFARHDPVGAIDNEGRREQRDADENGDHAPEADRATGADAKRTCRDVVVREEIVFTKPPALVAPRVALKSRSQRERSTLNPPPPCGEELEVGV